MKFESRSTDPQALIGNPEPGKGLRSTVMEAGLQFAREAPDAGRADLAKRVLEPLTSRASRAAAAWQLLGFAYRDEQRMPDATRSFERAAVFNPDDALTALGLAQSSFEVGLPAAQLFCRALELAPWHLAATLSAAAVLGAEQQVDGAEELLCAVLARQPDWLEGHRNLAALRWKAGDTHGFARNYAVACRVRPRDMALRLAWFRAMAQARRPSWACRRRNLGSTRPRMHAWNPKPGGWCCFLRPCGIQRCLNNDGERLVVSFEVLRRTGAVP